MIQDCRCSRHTNHGDKSKQTKKHPTEVKFLRIQGRPHLLLLISLRKTHASRRPGTSNGQSKPLLGVKSCLRCPGAHELASCLEFQNKDLQTRWDIVKRHRLCHVCMRSGHRRDRCESQRFYPRRSDKRHHRFLHNPQEETMETLNEATKPMNGNNNLRRISQTQGIVSIRARLNLGVQCSTQPQ